MKLQLVRPSVGLQWVKLGIITFWRAPLALMALFFLGMTAMSFVSVLPLLGSPLALALLPTTSLLMMLGASEAWSARTLRPLRLISALSHPPQRLRSLALLGLFYIIGFAATMALALGLTQWVDEGAFVQVYLGQAALTPELVQRPGFQTAMWLTMLLHLPLSLLLWHAPALVYWHGVHPAKAMFFSIVACLRNIGAFFLFGMAWLGLFMAAGIFLALMVPILGNASMLLLIVVAMTLVAMLFTSTVFTFRDCFSAPTDTATPAQAL